MTYRVFFAHTDPRLTGLYRDHFSPHFSFDSAYDGLHALRKIQAIRPHVVLSDFHLPSLSGLGLLKAMRLHPELNSVPFIFLSHDGDLGSALTLGANGSYNSDTHPREILGIVTGHIKFNQSYLNKV